MANAVSEAYDMALKTRQRLSNVVQVSSRAQPKRSLVAVQELNKGVGEIEESLMSDTMLQVTTAWIKKSQAQTDASKCLMT